MSGTLAGRIAVVTGGTGALGRWVVRDLSSRGARVFVPFVDQTEARELEALLADDLAEDAGRAVLRQTDVTQAAAVDELFASVARENGPVSVLCNLAGGFSFASIEETDAATWRRMIEMNATSTFLCSRAAVRQMKGSGWGRIVTVAARPALEGGTASMTAYGAAKAAVLNFTQALAQEVTGSGITVNTVVPTVIDTPANRAAMPNIDPATWLDPRDIAEVIRFLVSEAAGVVTGSAIALTPGGSKPAHV